MSNPKKKLTGNTQKNPDEWVSGDDPMTGAQASYLKTALRAGGHPRDVRRQSHQSSCIKIDRRDA